MLKSCIGVGKSVQNIISLIILVIYNNSVVSGVSSCEIMKINNSFTAFSDKEWNMLYSNKKLQLKCAYSSV